MSTTLPPSAIAPPVPEVTFKSRLLKVWNSWATRSLMVGAGATVLDIALGSTLLALGATARISAMVGVVLGAAFTFFANRRFAFKEQSGELAKPALRFVLATVVASVAHGQVVHMLRDNAGIPFVVAKMMADVAVFTFGQMLLLRYVVFPKGKAVPPQVSAAPPFTASAVDGSRLRST